MKQKKGFSIVEVLVALCIMGVVAGISVPNYTKMKRSSKKAEAQSSLGQIYISEKAFFLQWRTYTTDLKLIGAVPEGPLTYNVGFKGDHPLPDSYSGRPKADNTYSFFKICGKTFGGDESGEGEVEQCAFSYKKGGDYRGFEPPPISKVTLSNNRQCDVDTEGGDTEEGDTEEGDTERDKFTACAIANLVKKCNPDEPNPCTDPNNCGSNDKHCDTWSINQFKQIKRECASCPY